MAPLSLSQLLDAAIAAPDFQSVNFRALHSLLQAVLGHLGLQDRSPRGLEQPAERDRARTPAAGQQPQQAGEQLPAKDPLQDTAGGSEADVAAGVGQPVQRVEGDESSGSEDTAGYRALLEEISQMKEAQSRMQGEIRMIQEALGLGNRQDAAGRLPGLCDLRTLGSDVQMLKERLGLYPDPEEVSNMVHWDVLEDCLVGSKGERGRDGGRPRREEEEPSATTKSPASDADTPQGASSVLGPRESPAGLEDPGAALTAPEQQAGVPSDRRRDAGTRAMMQTASRDVQTTSLGTQPTRPESTGTQTTSRLGTQAESTITQTPISGERLSTQLAGAGPLAAGTLLPTAQGFEIPVDADARATAHVQELALPSGSGSAYHNAYKCYAETVEAVKQIGQLRHLYAALKEQVAQLEASRLERTELEKLRPLLQEGGPGQGAAGPGQGGAGREGEDQEAGERRWQTGGGQRQLANGCERPAEPALGLEEVRVMESTGQEAAACPMCSSDTSTRLGMVLRRYEKLQGLVESLMSRKKTGKAVRQLPGKSQQDEEVLKRIQAAILQMQGECEKLNSVTGSLLDDSRQQQKDIEGLLQSVERLEKEKADKEDLEMGMDEKADKGALESKVSRAQFEASLELLKERNQEVLSRVTGQEQGLHEVQQQLREEMASKLDRLELGPFQQELDEHWKSSLEQLKETAPPMEADDAAGIRKQLLVDFQCLSCDRQLGLRVPGSPIPPIPPFPPLVPHVTGRSQPVLKTEQTHREPMAACRYPTVPRQCGGQHTLTRPLQRSLRLPLIQPSAPEALQPSTLLPSKDKIELLGQDSCRAGPCPSAPGTTGPLEQRSGSSHSLLVQGHRPHPPLQPRRTDAATRQPGWTGGHQLNPIAPAPQQGSLWPQSGAGGAWAVQQEEEDARLLLKVAARGHLGGKGGGGSTRPFAVHHIGVCELMAQAAWVARLLQTGVIAQLVDIRHPEVWDKCTEVLAEETMSLGCGKNLKSLGKVVQALKKAIQEQVTWKAAENCLLATPKLGVGAATQTLHPPDDADCIEPKDHQEGDSSPRPGPDTGPDTLTEGQNRDKSFWGRLAEEARRAAEKAESEAAWPRPPPYAPQDGAEQKGGGRGEDARGGKKEKAPVSYWAHSEEREERRNGEERTGGAPGNGRRARARGRERSERAPGKMSSYGKQPAEEGGRTEREGAARPQEKRAGPERGRKAQGAGREQSVEL
ncbi:uncharacterized protein LOC136017490 [Lathamus discolor]|uniref:uncharacterized protein LOC136017490 n=1 Tax=Lathamus discolor TaxID=678569 RepID=UPI0032B7E71C